MLPIEERIVKIKLDSIPVGIGTSVYETAQLILSEFIHLPGNEYLEEIALDIFTELEDSPEEQGMRINIYANMLLEDAIAHKLFQWPN